MRDVEEMFRARLEEVRLSPAYLRLFRAVVLDSWEGQRKEARAAAEALQAQANKIHLRLDRLDEAFLFERRIDQDTYERQRDRLREELALVELAAHDSKIEEFDVEEVLRFAEYVLEHPGRLWAEADLRQRQALQSAVFPEGLSFDGHAVGTGVTCLAFMQLPGFSGALEGMASPGGFEPGCQP